MRLCLGVEKEVEQDLQAVELETYGDAGALRDVVNVEVIWAI